MFKLDPLTYVFRSWPLGVSFAAIAALAAIGGWAAAHPSSCTSWGLWRPLTVGLGGAAPVIVGFTLGSWLAWFWRKRDA
jgi:hypothetical protein